MGNAPFRRSLQKAGPGEVITRIRAMAALLFACVLLWTVSGCGAGSFTKNADEQCAEGEIGTPPECFPEPPISAAPGKTWEVVFSEEFNGTEYDRRKLTPCFDWNHGSCTSSFNKGKETYRPEQIRVSDGSAKLVAEPLIPPEQNISCYRDLCTYKAGLLSTARPDAADGSDYLFKFTYGYVESRMKFPAVPGFFTAFWMLPATPDYHYRSEIDIAEILGGSPSNVFQTYHYDERRQSYKVNGEGPDNGACPARDYSQDWVTFGVDWQPSHIAYFINGVKCGEFTDASQIENGPMQLILQMMVDNQWERDAGSVLEDQTLVNQLEVDYIRVYQQR